MKEIAPKDDIREARDYAFRLLSYCARTKQEILNKLRQKGYKDEVVTRVIEELERQKYLNDRVFALEWAEKRLKEKKGSELIRRELVRKGIEEEVIDDSLSKALANAGLTEEEIAWQAIDERSAHYTKLEQSRACARIRTFLIQRGFPEEVVENVLSRYLREYRRNADL